MQAPSRTSVRQAGVTAGTLFAAASCLIACTVVPIEADKAARERLTSGFNAKTYVDRIWSVTALPYWAESERPLPDVASAVRADLDAAGKSFGRRTGDGSPWVFPVRGEGVVSAVEAGRRAGSVTVSVKVATGVQPVDLRVGPVISGAALRDSLPSIQFNDFRDQLAYAEVGQALTARAMTQVRPAVAGLKIGDAVAFSGAMSLAGPAEPFVVTPYRLVRSSAAGPRQ